MSVADVEFGLASLAAAASSPAAGAAAPPRAGPTLGHDGDQTSARQSTAQTCFSDGLHSIFSFLTLREFGIASCCCLHWSAAGSTQPSLCLRREATADQLSAIAHSPLATHIDLLIITSCLPSEVSSVFSLCCRLSHLSHLVLIVRPAAAQPAAEADDQTWWGTDESHSPMQMPRTLRKLEVILCLGRSEDLEWSLIDSLLTRICHDDSPPLSMLRLAIDANQRLQIDTQIPVETLRRILVLKASLAELILAWQQPYFADESWVDRESPTGPARWTREHIDVFRQMTRLEKLDPFNGRWSDEELIMLCAEPAPAHLRHFPLVAPPETAAGGNALARLPLTELQFRYNRWRVVEDLSFLRHIPTLQVLSLSRVWQYASPAEIESLVDTLQAGCTQLTELAMPPPTTNAHLCRLLPSLPHLRILRVLTTQLEHRELRFGGLSFASSVSHLADTLEELHLIIHSTSEPMPLSELHHLHVLRSLRHLHLSLLLELATPRPDLRRAIGEFTSSQTETFRRDRWPHMVQSTIDLTRHYR